MKENNLRLRCIDDLLNEDFFIPDFQRGYRWASTQVKTLLDDIWKFRQENHEASKEVFYCLQPVVVAKGKQAWVLIDGQQRLTTIHLILTYLKNVLGKRTRRNFTIRYQTRPDSENFLEEPTEDKSSENPDYHHMFEAYKTIEQWFEEKDSNAEINFIQTLLNTDDEGKNVKVIWYEVNNDSKTSYIDIFTRLNIGKILLTNAELIKALLLKKGNFEEQQVSLKQIQIASEWDNVERTLHQPDFWYFIYDKNNPLTYDNRIEYILDQMYKRNRDHEYYYTFFEFLNEYQNSKTNSGKIDIDSLWLKVKHYFLIFEEWFYDRDLYHLVGFLVECGLDINTLKENSREKNKDVFKNYLHDEIKKQVNFQIDELEYGSKRENEQIRKVLLLFNIQTLMINKGADVRFPFDRYKTGEWDIEHIRSQTE